MADISSNLFQWSATAANNNPSGTTTIGTGLDDNLRQIQATVRGDLANKGSDIASATTTDLGAVVGLMHDITGTTTITGFGTVSAGLWKIVKFEGALTLTHNATSLILPGSANIVTVAGDVGIFMSEGSGNWRCLAWLPTLRSEVAKGWAYFNASATLNDSFNVTSVTDTGTGDALVTWATDFSSANHANFVSINTTTALICRVNVIAAGTTVVNAYDISGPSLADPSVGYFVAAFGDQ